MLHRTASAIGARGACSDREGVEDLIAAYSSEAGQVAGAELLEDEGRFIDLLRSPLWLGEEHVVVDSR